MFNSPIRIFEGVLDNEGLHGGLEFLNHRVLHRFTALYKLDQPFMRNVDLVDKEGSLGLPDLEEVPLTDSFCQFVLRDGRFLTGDSGNDQRLDGHKYKGVVGSYVGLPLLDNSGELWGTFCHFDVLPRELRDDEFVFLQQVARLLPGYLPER